VLLDCDFGDCVADVAVVVNDLCDVEPRRRQLSIVATYRWCRYQKHWEPCPERP
jgi:hypothetical protein